MKANIGSLRKTPAIGANLKKVKNGRSINQMTNLFNLLYFVSDFLNCQERNVPQCGNSDGECLV